MPAGDGLIAPDEARLVDKTSFCQRLSIRPGLGGHIQAHQPKGALLRRRKMGPGQVGQAILTRSICIQGLEDGTLGAPKAALQAQLDYRFGLSMAA